MATKLEPNGYNRHANGCTCTAVETPNGRRYHQDPDCRLHGRLTETDLDDCDEAKLADLRAFEQRAKRLAALEAYRDDPELREFIRRVQTEKLDLQRVIDAAEADVAILRAGIKGR